MTANATGRLEGRIALVTGASRGIGRAVARAFVREGAHVIALARTVGGLEELDDEARALGGAVTLVPCDVTHYEGLDILGQTIFERWGKLDVFVANAGALGELAPLGHIAPKKFEETFAVNVTSNWRLIRSLDPLLRASDAGRALFVSSNVATAPRAYWGLYASTKAALESLAYTYAAETENTSVRVSIINPGATATAMRARAMPGEDASKLPHPNDIAPLFVERASPDYDGTDARIDYREWNGRASA